MPHREAELLPGTLDLHTLKAVLLGQLHGYGILIRIGQVSGDVLNAALYRLETKGSLAAEWGVSDNNRSAKFYSLTASGKKRLREETAGGQLFVAAVTEALGA